MLDEAKQLVEKLNDPKNWPGFSSNEYFQSLQKIAMESKERQTVDGYLAAILIIHQLTEEMLKLLIDEAEFYVQLKLYPLPFKKKKKQRMMFGQILSEIESSVWFQNKKYIIEKSAKLNKIRIEIVHGLTKRMSLDNLKTEADEAWGLYCSIHFMGLEAHMIFQDSYMEFYRDDNWPPNDTLYLNDDGMIL